MSNLNKMNDWQNSGATTKCGSACGAGDKPEEKPSACGSACGASDK